MFLDPTDASPSSTVSWPDAEAALGRPLTERTIAFVYFETDQKDGGQSILELSESAHATSYSVTLPDAGYNVGSSAILEVMIELHHWLASSEKGISIVVGNELVAGQDWAAEENRVGRALEEPLVEWLCCAKSEMSPHLDEFEVVQELDDVVILRKTM